MCSASCWCSNLFNNRWPWFLGEQKRTKLPSRQRERILNFSFKKHNFCYSLHFKCKESISSYGIQNFNWYLCSTGTLDAIIKMIRYEGLPGFYKGMSTKIVQSVFAASVLFMVKEELVKAYMLLAHKSQKVIYSLKKWPLHRGITLVLVVFLFVYNLLQIVTEGFIF